MILQLYYHQKVTMPKQHPKKTFKKNRVIKEEIEIFNHLE